MTKRRHRRHSIAKKRELVEAYLNGEALNALSKQHDVCRNLIRVWIEKYERDEYDDDAVEADLVPEYEARVAALEQLVGRQALEIEFLKEARKHGPSPRSALGSVITGPVASRSDGGVNS